MRTRLVQTLVVIALSVLAPGCRKNPAVTFQLTIPSDLVDQTLWFEVGAFRGASCGPLNVQIAAGIPDDGSVVRVAFRKGDRDPPAIGDLPKAPYAFAAVAKASDCTVLASGCVQADVNDARGITIDLKQRDDGGGTCVSGGVCAAARCVPANDNKNPTVGAGCSLQLLGAGPLGNPLGASGTLVSAPAIAPIDTGFMIAYREVDPSDGTARLSVLPIDSGGGALDIQTRALPGRCAGSDESDATGLVMNGSVGLVALGRALCGSVGGIDLLTIDSTGAVGKAGFTGAPDVNVTLANAHSLVARPSGNLLVATQDGTTRVASIVSDIELQSGAAPAFGGNPPQSAGWAATSDAVLALLAAGTGASSSPADAGADGGDAGDAEPPPGPDAGGSSSTLRLHVVPLATATNALGRPYEFPGTWGSVAAKGTRVIVASDGTSPGRPVAWRAFDLGTAGPVATDGFAIDGPGKVAYADVAMQQDHAFFVAERPGSITLVAYDHATTMPTSIRQVSFSKDPRIPSVATVRDGRVAVAASDTRVGVAWTTGRTLGMNDAVGGYAVFACTTP